LLEREADRLEALWDAVFAAECARLASGDAETDPSPPRRGRNAKPLTNGAIYTGVRMLNARDNLPPTAMLSKHAAGGEEGIYYAIS
jgi:hypothetical protein